MVKGLAFDKMKTAPRQHRVIKGAATTLIPVLVKSGVDLVRNQLDQLMPQFEESNPAFHNAYFAARVVVNSRGKKVAPVNAVEVTKKAA